MIAQISGQQKGATTDLVFEIHSGCVPPPLPPALQQLLSPSTWDDRLRSLIETLSYYSIPIFEKVYIIFGIFVTFFVPIATYDVILGALTGGSHDLDAHVGQAKLISFGMAIATLLFVFTPLFLWKYMGKRRVQQLLLQWTQEDIKTIPPYLSLPVWNASNPRLCNDIVVLVVTVPVTQSNFHPDVCLPPYVAIPNQVAPPYMDRRSRLARHIDGAPRLSEIPLYADRRASSMA